jgi:GcrA cell cycle regulator
MWAEGQSASQIAKELGGVTRNAVIGKVHRLGLSNRVGPGTVAEDDGEAAPVVAAPAPAPAKPAAAPRPAAPTAVQETPRPAPVAPAPQPAPVAAAEPVAPAPTESSTITFSPQAPIPLRKAIIPAGQPLPPQPSANEISPEALASVREVEKRAKKLSLMELTERTCKWPIGDPATEDFWFCGLPSVAGKPYCEAHVGVAFQPMSARRDRRR